MASDAVIAAARALLEELGPGCRCSYCGGDGSWTDAHRTRRVCEYCHGSGLGPGVEAAKADLEKALGDEPPPARPERSA